jgi:hypothetical protein
MLNFLELRPHFGFLQPKDGPILRAVDIALPLRRNEQELSLIASALTRLDKRPMSCTVPPAEISRTSFISGFN